MSRKASERRVNPDAFVEANLWVVTRGRPYKPRFKAERAVVVVTGGGGEAFGAVSGVGVVTGSNAGLPADVNNSRLSSRNHPMSAVLDSHDTVAALFANTACDCLFVLDYKPLQKDLVGELSSPYPGRVAKPVSRLLQKLNITDACLVAHGHDTGVLLKILSAVGDATKSVVLHKPDVANSNSILAGARAVVADGVAGKLMKDLRIHLSNNSNSADPNVTRLMEQAFPNAEFLTNDDDENLMKFYGVGNSDDVNKHSLPACVVAAAKALEERDGVPPPPSWLAGEETPVFYNRVTFEHDKNSKQIAQQVENVTDVVVAAMEAMEAEREVGTESDVKIPEASAKETERETVNTADSTADSSASESKETPMVYVAKRPFYPKRLKKTLLEHFANLTTGPVTAWREQNALSASVAAAAASTASAASAAAAAAVEAEAMAKVLMTETRGIADPAALAAAASAAVSSSAAAASASAAVAAAALLARLVGSETSTAATSSLSNYEPSTASTRPPSGPFAGVLNSNGAVWLANRPAVRGAWVTPDSARPGDVQVTCGGAGWDDDLSQTGNSRSFPLPPSNRWSCVFVGERRTELVFKGTEAMDRTAMRAALDSCLLTEDEIEEVEGSDEGSTTPETLEKLSGGLCFAPWPMQVAHLASLGVRLCGRGSAALAMQAQTRLHAWQKVDGGGGSGTGNVNSVVFATAGVANLSTTTPQKPTGAAGLRFGGKVGVNQSEAFLAPPKGTEIKQFPEGIGHFWPKMPCLECGSPWWLGDGWDAECANCGGDAESYDNTQQPHKAYKRRYVKFKELIDQLDRK